MDRTTLALLPSEGLDALAPDQSEKSEKVNGTDVTNQQTDPAVKQEASVSESAPVFNVLDNGHPSNTVQSYTESCLAKLSEPQTRSVYGVTSDPVMSEPRVTPVEKSLCVYETRERQTPDKHTSEASQEVDLKGVEPQTAAPEINKAPSASPNSDSKPCVEEPVTFPQEDTEPAHAHKNKSPTKHRQLGAAYSSPQQRIVPQDSDSSHEGVHLVPCAASISDSPVSELHELQGSPEDTLEDTNDRTKVTKAKCIPEAELNTISHPADSSSQSTGLIRTNIAEAQDRNKTDDICISTLSAQSNEQNAEVFPDPQISVPQEDSLFVDTELNEQANNAEKQIVGIEPSHYDESKRYASCLESDTPLKEGLDAELNGSQSAPIAQMSKSSAASKVFISERKSALPIAFRDLLRSMCTPVHSKSTLRTRGRLWFH